MNGPMRGIDNSTMAAAYKVFKAREQERKKVPKKRRTDAAESIDLSSVTLDGGVG